jgi:metal-dependent amidase/aminoacylase/carboxypeptidase family protein
LEGTVRTLLPQNQDMIQQEMGQMVHGLAAAHGCTASLDYGRGVPATITDPEMTALARRAMARVMPAECLKLQEQVSMGAEDFSLFLQRCPGALLWVGCADPGAGPTKPLHHPGFIGDEACLETAMTALAAIALEVVSQ